MFPYKYFWPLDYYNYYEPKVMKYFEVQPKVGYLYFIIKWNDYKVKL